MNTTTTNLHIFFVLISREIRLVTSKLKNNVIDCIPPLIAQVTTFGYLFPLLGMSESMIAPIYLGAMLPLFMQLGYQFVLRTASDLDQQRFIDYHITLPVTKRWIFGAYIVSHVLETMITVVPLLMVGIFYLHTYFPLAAINIGTTFTFFIVLQAFFATFFLAISYSFPLTWLMDNTWPRILVPCFLLSSSLVLWKKTYVFWPMLSYIMLISPMTYVVEGVRSVMLNSDTYISVWICIPALLVYIMLNSIVLIIGIRKRLDPV